MVVELLGVILVGGVVCDGIHAFLHRASHSRSLLLRALASLHQSHHDFLDRSLRFHDDRLRANLLTHQLPETIMRGLVLSGLTRLTGADPVVGIVGVALVLLDFAGVVARRGRDRWHRDGPLMAPGRGLLVDPDYHLMHHVFPDHFLAAHVQVLDRLLGTLLPLKDRVVVVVGGSLFGHELGLQLTRAGAQVRRVACDPRAASEVAVDDVHLAAADILVFGHGAEDRGDASYEALLARAQTLHAKHVAPLEVWTLDSDAAWEARAPLLVNQRTVLRRIDRAHRLGAAVTLWLLRRGLRSL